jgi:hypothetical protein
MHRLNYFARGQWPDASSFFFQPQMHRLNYFARGQQPDASSFFSQPQMHRLIFLPEASSQLPVAFLSATDAQIKLTKLQANG